jgi:hypothetical protein
MPRQLEPKSFFQAALSPACFNCNQSLTVLLFSTDTLPAYHLPVLNRCFPRNVINSPLPILVGTSRAFKSLAIEWYPQPAFRNRTMYRIHCCSWDYVRAVG